MDKDYLILENDDNTFDVVSTNTCKSFPTYEEAVKYLLLVEDDR